MEKPSYVFGPVPSRRLGRSLGIDLVPYKTCTYDCIYCQLGPTTNKTIERKEYVPIDDALEELKEKLRSSDSPDYISFSGSGEPTLHSRIGEAIDRVKTYTTTPVAVLTNGSLLWQPELRDQLKNADLVIPSLDGGDSSLFEQVNRPHPGLSFDMIIEGLVDFSSQFPGAIWLEVFLLAGLSDNQRELEKIAKLVDRMRPERVQLNTVSRPPAKSLARPVTQEQLIQLSSFLPGTVEVISETPPTSTPIPRCTQGISDEILSLLKRRPCTAEGVATGLGIHISVAIKYLHQLTIDTKIEIAEGGFYVAIEPKSTSSESD